MEDMSWLPEEWKAFADDKGNYGYILYGDDSTIVLYYDDDAFHCQTGAGYGWKIYERDMPDLNDVVYDLETDDMAYGFHSFEETYADLEEQIL